MSKNRENTSFSTDQPIQAPTKPPPPPDNVLPTPTLVGLSLVKPASTLTKAA